MGMVDNTSHISDDIAILLDDKVDKYHPGNQVFKLQALTGLQENSKSITTEKFSTSFLLNKDKTPFMSKLNVDRASALVLPLSIEFTRDYPKKYIPIGTRFTISFKNGDITKPYITGRMDS